MKTRLPPLEPPKIAAYSRVSTRAQANPEKFGVSRQRGIIEAAAAREFPGTGLEWFEDAVSGKLKERTGLDSLLERAGEFRAVFVAEIDRLGRSELVTHLLHAELMGAGLEVYGEDGKVDLEDDSSALMFSMRAVLAAQESRRFKRRVIDAKLAALERGLLPIGWNKYGYRAIGEGAHRRLEPHPEQAAVIARIFRDLASGVKTSEIAAALKREGVPRSLGGTNWTMMYVWKIARDAAYRGELRVTLRRFSREFKLTVPALVTPELWQAAQHGVERKPFMGERARGLPFAGIELKCAECGRSMLGGYFPSGKNRREKYARAVAEQDVSLAYYRCGGAKVHKCAHNRVYHAPKLIQAASFAVREFLEEDFNPSPGVPMRDEREIQRLEREIKKTREDLERFRRDYARGLPLEAYLTLNGEAEERQKRLEVELREAIAPPIRADIEKLAAQARARMIALPALEAMRATGAQLELDRFGNLYAWFLGDRSMGGTIEIDTLARYPEGHPTIKVNGRH